MTVVVSHQRIVFDDLNAMEPVRIFETGASMAADLNSFGEFKLSLRDGAIISPKIPVAEPLRTLCQDFVRCIRSGEPPIADAESGAEVVRVLEAIDRSLTLGGCRADVRTGAVRR